MENISKDILGIIVGYLDVGEVLKLRLMCKHLKDCIASFNKYWFYWYFKENDADRFQMLVETGLSKHNYFASEKSLPSGETFQFPYLECISHNHDIKPVKESMIQDSDYHLWKREANSLEFFDGENELEKFETAYCLMQYCKKAEHLFVIKNIIMRDIQFPNF